MTKLTIRNLTNSPFDIEGGHRLPAMGSITEEFSNHYAALLRASPGVEVMGVASVAATPAAPAPSAEQPKRRGRKA